MSDTTLTPLTGEKIRELRIAAGLSQQELAVAAGLSRNTVQTAESGRRINRRSERKLRTALTKLQPPAPDRLGVVEAELAELTRRVNALTAGQAA